MKLKKGFASDNWSGVCPEVMKALEDVNPAHNEAYGELNDPVTEAAITKFEQHFGEDISVYFVYNGTAANVLVEPADAFVAGNCYSAKLPI